MSDFISHSRWHNTTLIAARPRSESNAGKRVRSPLGGGETIDGVVIMTGDIVNGCCV